MNEHMVRNELKADEYIYKIITTVLYVQLEEVEKMIRDTISGYNENSQVIYISNKEPNMDPF